LSKYDCDKDQHDYDLYSLFTEQLITASDVAPDIIDEALRLAVKNKYEVDPEYALNFISKASPEAINRAVGSELKNLKEALEAEKPYSGSLAAALVTHASPETTNSVANEIDFIVPGLIARYRSTYGEFNTIYELSRFLSPSGICRAFDQLKSCGMLKHMKDSLDSMLAEALENASLERLDDDQANQLVIDCIAAGTMPRFLPRLVEKMGNAGFNLCRALEYAIKNEARTELIDQLFQAACACHSRLSPSETAGLLAYAIENPSVPDRKKAISLLANESVAHDLIVALYLDVLKRGNDKAALKGLDQSFWKIVGIRAKVRNMSPQEYVQAEARKWGMISAQEAKDRDRGSSN
jgi:hypothetical protein